MKTSNETILARQYRRAKAEGRICERCGWLVPVKNWKKGHRLCPGCFDALKGINVKTGSQPYKDDPEELTGEMT